MDGATDEGASAVRRYYQANAEGEWDRLAYHRVEHAITCRVLRETLPQRKLAILDVGGGPGRYAIPLAGQGHRVTVVDLSPNCLSIAEEKAQGAGVELECLEGDARDLAAFADESFEALLLMGPLYHLPNRNDRLRALCEARRVLKPSGLLFASFINRYANLLYDVAHLPGEVLQRRQVHRSILDSGVHDPDRTGGYFTLTYLAHPSEVEPLLTEAGFELKRLVNCEAIAGNQDQGLNGLAPEEWETWMDICYQVADDPYQLAAGSHLLAVGAKG